MFRKIDKRAVYNTGRNKASQELINLHMSNHYRRILNAKKVIDNSPPYCYKAKTLENRKAGPSEKKEIPAIESLPLTDRSVSTNSNKDSCYGAESGVSSSRYHAKCVPRLSRLLATKRAYGSMNLYKIINYDSKNDTVARRNENCPTKTKGEQENMKSNPKLNIRPKSCQTKMTSSPERRNLTANYESAQKRKFSDQKKIKSSGVKGNKSFSSLDDNINSKELKTEAVSKLRSLRVYHPPRRKESRAKTESTSDEIMTCNLEAPNCKFTKISDCDAGESFKKISFNPNEQSLTSSRDSAYNGGVSSLPESRSPTPDHRQKKDCCCNYDNKKKEKEKLFESSEAVANAIESPKMCTKSEGQDSFKQIQEDALYVKFIQDITTEILDKNLYTNKALKSIMKKHMKNNMKTLQKDRMLKEVETLRIQLGIPEDKSLLEVESKDQNLSYPIISDSEFVMPGKEAKGTKTGDKMGKSISAVISLTRQDERVVSGSETEDVISVIQVMKAVRERRVERSVGREYRCSHNSTDESDRPSDHKKRSFLKGRKQKFVRTYSSTSSESEISGKFSRKFREKLEGSTSKETYLGSYGERPSFFLKKSRNVSFWKNPELNLRRTFEVKQKKVTRGKESIRPRNKND